jgi:hypothetical protein
MDTQPEEVPVDVPEEENDTTEPEDGIDSAQVRSSNYWCAEALALAQVVKVGPHRTELQQLAGPALASHGAWMALPL